MMREMHDKVIESDNPKITIHCSMHDLPIRPFPKAQGGKPEDIATALLELKPGEYDITFDYLSCPEGDMCLETWVITTESVIVRRKIKVFTEEDKEYLDSEILKD